MLSILETNNPKENKISEYWGLFEKNGPFLGIDIKGKSREFLKNKCHVTCFSSDYELSDIYGKSWKSGYEHPTMWTHYAEKYKGVCLVIDKELFINENRINEKNDYILEKVKYENMILAE